ncbi:hypothetical protein Pint_36102 [Pistacia integerrima]|uniref:Uncharacterized protein n=1 Tax=Pistacia integerrima TaxID=434235 RepID=A0ACC0XZX1_9ROSI|nr:hypothetical protein Pint_36102 [Pistacia integerrima]
MENGFVMSLIPVNGTTKTARFLILVFNAVGMAGKMENISNGDGNHRAVIFQGRPCTELKRNSTSSLVVISYYCICFVPANPRFNASDLLEHSRNGRIVFAGDSIGRNQWESFVCMLAQAVPNKSTIYEENGKPITKHKGFLSMRFQEYNMTVEYYRVPFLVVIGRPPQNSSQEVQRTIRVDELHWFSKKWIGANVLIFNDGHWWNEDKTSKMGIYFQEGGKINTTMDVMEAFRRSLQTLKSWVIKNLDRERSHTFFRSYSPVHYRQELNISRTARISFTFELCRNGTWNKGGFCDREREPETIYTRLGAEALNNHFISDVIKQMRNENRKVQFLNITYLTEFRSDGHPSFHREPGTPTNAPQDCSHWCLPGVPDTWNELLYAYLLSMEFKTK